MRRVGSLESAGFDQRVVSAGQLVEWTRDGNTVPIEFGEQGRLQIHAHFKTSAP